MNYIPAFQKITTLFKKATTHHLQPSFHLLQRYGLFQIPIIHIDHVHPVASFHPSIGHDRSRLENGKSDKSDKCQIAGWIAG